ncbi:hypothetical protein TREMEDRAFT_57981, partial [Tremella mesenterica DSM 1558]|uniref:uncharacterized protein n=1 Tax=Tremella mesenterica (strain ATCC 24925 / CBS 8224 / DSM 1558 / NBRC 9311 / NRRL Y-6157 / RJB 2259-6 / UBC 559-6) TaxID=578456 RepID=UPI00032D28DE
MWLYSWARNKDTSTARLERLDVALYAATCIPIQLPSTPGTHTSTPSQPRSQTTSSHKRQRLEQAAKRRDDLFWATIVNFMECKLRLPMSGFAQTCAYSLITFEQCGNRSSLYIYKTRFTFVLVVDEETLIVEVKDSRKWGKRCKISELGRFDRDLLVYDLDQGDDTTLPASPSQSRQSPIPNQGIRVFTQYVTDCAKIAQDIPIDATIDRNSLIECTRKIFDDLLAQIESMDTG